jgi:hypothetical protein
MDFTTVLNAQIAEGALASFPKSPSLREDFVRAGHDLCRALETRGRRLGLAETQGLVVKLAKYAGKRQWQIAKLADDLPTIADAIDDNLEALANPKMTLTAILNKHNMLNQQVAAKHRRALLADPAIDVPTPIMAKSKDGKIQLVECLTQRHLKQETAELGHCVGGMSLDHYSASMAAGDTRIFSLRTPKGKSLATLEYQTRTGAIKQIEKGGPDRASRLIKGNEAFFPALCQTIHALSLKLPIGSMAGLPEPPVDTVLTIHGEFLEASAVQLDAILAGTVCVKKDVPPHELDRLCQTPRLTLDVTELDLGRLPSKIACSLVSDADVFDAPQLVEAGNITAKEASRFTLPRLEKVGRFTFGEARDLDLPALREAGGIETYKAETVRLPCLEKCGDFFANVVDQLSLPSLQTVGFLSGPWLDSLSLPRLVQSGTIMANNLEHMSLPCLKKSEDLIFHATPEVDLPSLLLSQDIEVQNARTLNLPQLTRSLNIFAASAGEIDLSALQEVSLIDASSATSLDLSGLRKAESVYALKLEEVVCPHLETADYIMAPKASVLKLPSLKVIEQIDAPVAKTVDLRSLETAEALNLEGVTALGLPKLKAVDTLSAGNAHTIVAPNLPASFRPETFNPMKRTRTGTFQADYT